MRKAFTAGPALVLAGMALALGLGACGGGDEPEDEARDAANEYFDALAAGDARAVCDHLTAESQAAYRRQRRVDDCAEAVGAILGGSRGATSREFARQIEIRRVRVNGDTATVETATQQGFGLSVEMRREEGEWRVAQSPGR